MSLLHVYLGCLVFGWSLLLVSLFMGHDVDGGSGFHLHFDADGDLEPGDAGGGAIHGEGVVAALKYLSLRNVVFFTAFFGLTGSVLSLLDAHRTVAFALAVAMGVFASTLLSKMVTFLRRTEVGELSYLNRLEGSKARVLVDVSRERRGKVLVEAGGNTVQLLALVAEESIRDAYSCGDCVTIIHIKDGIAHVAEDTFINI